MLFRDRHQAGERLAERLRRIAPAEAIVVALPRGGVPVGEVIARELGLPLDVILVRKVGAPMQPELAVAAVTDGEKMRLTVNEDIKAELGLSDSDIEALANKQLREIERRRAVYYAESAPLPLKEKTVIVVDDGVATGATANAALRLIRQHEPTRLILALPVAPAETISELERHADEIVCLSTPHPFRAVGAHYVDFDQVSDHEVVEALRRNREETMRGQGSVPGGARS
ncbi:phosphoribosyltransferase [Oricola thermophila]|uniref:Phosphoribosyltransferase n=2 Tax=Oricola thermophila TaxID=2742145 RepID=A0A6N1VFY6_9HYPH|nr:phosphoribosyltransferase [Oricola thermophila]